MTTVSVLLSRYVPNTEPTDEGRAVLILVTDKLKALGFRVQSQRGGRAFSILSQFQTAKEWAAIVWTENYHILTASGFLTEKDFVSSLTSQWEIARPLMEIDVQRAILDDNKGSLRDKLVKLQSISDNIRTFCTKAYIGEHDDQDGRTPNGGEIHRNGNQTVI